MLLFNMKLYRNKTNIEACSVKFTTIEVFLLNRISCKYSYDKCNYIKENETINNKIRWNHKIKNKIMQYNLKIKGSNFNIKQEYWKPLSRSDFWLVTHEHIWRKPGREQILLVDSYIMDKLIAFTTKPQRLSPGFECDTLAKDKVIVFTSKPTWNPLNPSPGFKHGPFLGKYFTTWIILMIT